MVARPSLKRVVPGSVPPWRALCAESARALKAFFSVLCVSKSVLLLDSKFGQILRALNLRAFWVRPSCPRVDAGAAGPRRSFCGLAVARPRVVPGSFPLRARVFRGPVVVSGCRASIFVPLPWFSTSGRKHGSDALARLKRPCCGAAPFFFRRQARSSKLEASKP